MTTGTWVPVATLPVIGKVNGFWDSIPVIVYVPGRAPFGAYFTFIGGDDLYPNEVPLPYFHTDEGLPQQPTHWMAMPSEIPNAQ